MNNLINGVHAFQKEPFAQKQELFESLSGGQSPQTLFITCSDSRIVPNLVTQTDPGELFVIRNAGNLVPVYEEGIPTSEATTIEYAINALQIPNIVICGHSQCGAMGGLLDIEHLNALPVVKARLSEEPAADRARALHPDAEGDQLLRYTIQENVLVQLENLKTHPSVANALSAGRLNLYGWIYQFETGDVFVHQDQTRQFASVREDEGPVA